MREETWSTSKVRNDTWCWKQGWIFVSEKNCWDACSPSVSSWKHHWSMKEIGILSCDLRSKPHPHGRGQVPNTPSKCVTPWRTPTNPPGPAREALPGHHPRDHWSSPPGWPGRTDLFIFFLFVPYKITKTRITQPFVFLLRSNCNLISI